MNVCSKCDKKYKIAANKDGFCTLGGECEAKYDFD